MNVNCLLENDGVTSQRSVDELGPRTCSTGLTDQDVEKAEFTRPEVQQLITSGGSMTSAVHDNALAGNGVVVVTTSVVTPQ